MFSRSLTETRKKLSLSRRREDENSRTTESPYLMVVAEVIVVES